MSSTEQDDARGSGTLSYAAHAQVHLISTIVLVSMTQWIAFRGLENGVAAFAFWSAAIAVALGFSHVFQVLILDLISDFDYRQKFAAFLTHAAALLLPWFLLRLEGPQHALSSLLFLVALHAVRKEHHGRVMMLCGLLLLLRAVLPDGVPIGWLALWVVVFLLHCRALYIRTVLQAMREPDGPPLRDEWRLWTAPLVLVVTAGIIVYFACEKWLPPYVAPVQKQTGTIVLTQMGPVAITSVVWNTLLVVASVIALLVLLNFIEKKLRQWRRKKTDEEVELESRISRDTLRPAQKDAPIPTMGSGPRERVLRAFAALARAAEPVGLGRNRAETPREFLRRIGGLVTVAGPVPDAVFNRACYSDLPVTAEEAEDFATRAELAAGALAPGDSSNG